MDRYDMYRHNKRFRGDEPAYTMEPERYGNYIKYEDYERAINWLREAVVDAADLWAEGVEVDSNARCCGTDIKDAFNKRLGEC